MITINDTRSVNVSGGAAVPYRYRLHNVAVHFGRTFDGERGSEHTIDRTRFPAEVLSSRESREIFADPINCLQFGSLRELQRRDDETARTASNCHYRRC